MPVWMAAAIGGSALIGGAASIFGAETGADAATKASQLQAQQQQAALSFQQQVYGQGQTNLSPYMQAGLAGIGNANGAFGSAAGAFGQAGGAFGQAGGAYGSAAGAFTNAGLSLGSATNAWNNTSAASASLNPYVSLGQGAVGQLANLYGMGGGKPDYSGFTNSPDYNFAFSQGQSAVQNTLNASGQGGMSGGGLAALTNFGQGLASQQYGNYFSRLTNLAGIGSQAAGQQIQGYGAAGAGFTGVAQGYGNIGQGYTGIGQGYTGIGQGYTGVGQGYTGIGQGYNQIASIGGNAATGSTNFGSNMSNTIGSSYGGLGQAQASGVVGAANAITGGATGVANAANAGISNYQQYQMLQNQQAMYQKMMQGNPSSYGQPLNLASNNTYTGSPTPGWNG